MNWYRFTPTFHIKINERFSLDHQWEVRAESVEAAIVRLQKIYCTRLNLDSFTCERLELDKSWTEEFVDFSQNDFNYKMGDDFDYSLLEDQTNF